MRVRARHFGCGFSGTPSVFSLAVRVILMSAHLLGRLLGILAFSQHSTAERYPQVFARFLANLDHAQQLYSLDVVGQIHEHGAAWCSWRQFCSCRLCRFPYSCVHIRVG